MPSSQFLDHLERSDRHNGAATRNARLAAVHAFARYAAAGHPEHLELCQRILAVPFKRARPRLVEYLEAGEIRALLDAPDRANSRTAAAITRSSSRSSTPGHACRRSST